MNQLRDVNKPKTQRGRRALEKRAPKVVENDKNTLLIRGGHTSQTIERFLKDIYSLKKPLAMKLKWRNPVLPFQDPSFIEKMCLKYDCSLFVVGLHSKKCPHNVVIGRLHDGEILDMFELGIKNYVPVADSQHASTMYGEKSMLLFSGELFDETRENTMLKSLLIDLFRGPTVENIRTHGVEHQMHFILKSPKQLAMRMRRIVLKSVAHPGRNLKDSSEPENNTSDETLPIFKTPSGQLVQLSLEKASPCADFELRRTNIPSEDKWKRAHRVPPEVRKADKKVKNKEMDVFGSRVGRVHVGKSPELQELRPGQSLRTALTGHRKQGFDRATKTKATKSKRPMPAGQDKTSKKRKLYSDS